MEGESWSGFANPFSRTNLLAPSDRGSIGGFDKGLHFSPSIHTFMPSDTNPRIPHCFRKAAAVLTEDSLFLTLLQDPQSKTLSEERALEILSTNIPFRSGIGPDQGTGVLNELVHSSLRDDLKQHKEHILSLNAVSQCPSNTCPRLTHMHFLIAGLT